MNEWVYEPVVWSDSWRLGEWIVSRHPRRHNGYYVVTFRGEEVTLKDSLELAKRFVERQTT
jgi:uncharacterized protein (DUF2062 family)